ncbi:MAG: alpha/beta hydrolase [Gemmatimonadaceae bacterium]|nr:alpha/beta hydrolase [Gemmatimonadaceae bacterium]
MRRTLIFIVLLGACGRATPVVPPITAPAPIVAPALPRSATPRPWAALDTGAMRAPIFFATTRRAAASDRPGLRYSGEDADSLQFAAVLVNIPSYKQRGSGALPTPSAIRVNPFSYRPDPTKDVFVSSVIPVDSARFVQRVAADLATTRSRDLLVFVHGFNTSFEEAAVRAAQIVADLDFDGTTVVFSWPSAASITGYLQDQQAARNAGDALLRLLRGHLPAARPDRLHLLGHSMGSEVIGKAMTLTTASDSLPRFEQVVFAAPDVDARVFRREILPRLTPRARRITLYASDADEALVASRSVNNVWRLGLAGDSLVVLPGMETIDASRIQGDLLGHVLFGNQVFLGDLAALLRDGRPPAERRLLPVTRNGSTWWRFRGDVR